MQDNGPVTVHVDPPLRRHSDRDHQQATLLKRRDGHAHTSMDAISDGYGISQKPRQVAINKATPATAARWKEGSETGPRFCSSPGGGVMEKGSGVPVLSESRVSWKHTHLGVCSFLA